MKIAITGANSSVGKALLDAIAARGDVRAVAGVRSLKSLGNSRPPYPPPVQRRAAPLLHWLPLKGGAIVRRKDHSPLEGESERQGRSPQPSRWGERISPMEIDYGDNDSLVHCFEGADSVVHLAGILMEGRGSDYHSANVAATVAVVRAAAAAGVGHLVFISVIGADPDSSNAYFRSKGLAEQAVLGGGIKATVIRTPILLGRGTAGAAAMAAAASRPTARLLGGGRYIMRPLDVRDLTAAILNSCDRQRSGTQEQGHGGIAQGQQQRGDGSQSVYEIVGPEAIPYHELIRRIGCMKGTDIRVGTVPIWAAKLGAAIGSRLRGGGITPTVIDVITRDETVPHNDAAALGVTLTPLTNTLRDMLK